ncbi:MAG: hypothetical protein ABTR07_17860 [Candidatus Competibacter denitrificans]
MPPFTQALIVANVALFLLMQAGWRWFGTLALWPLNSGFFMPWQPISYAFLHAGLTHLNG